MCMYVYVNGYVWLCGYARHYCYTFMTPIVIPKHAPVSIIYTIYDHIVIA